MLKLVNLSLKKLSAGCLLLGLLGVIFYDSMYHFDVDLIHLKRQHHSAQRNWNLFYDQRYVFNDSAFRYEADFNAIKNIIQPKSVLLSDIASSYYAATYLPIYVRNIHRHHGRAQFHEMQNFLKSQRFCYLKDPLNINYSKDFFASENNKLKESGSPLLKYIIINKDVENLNLRTDCFWVFRHQLLKYLEHLAVLKFEGKNLNLYELK